MIFGDFATLLDLFDSRRKRASQLWDHCLRSKGQVGPLSRAFRRECSSDSNVSTALGEVTDFYPFLF